MRHERTIEKLMVSIIAGALVPTSAIAGPAPTDMFSVQTKVKTQPGAAATDKALSTVTSKPVSIVEWFESYDQTVAALRPTEGDKAILARPFNKEKERLDQWIKVAAKVSRNYHLLAANLRKMNLPPDAPEVKTYRDLRADWYEDAAGVYDELLRPCSPAKTVEELQDQLNQVSENADGLKLSATRLSSMDLSLREQYKVHQPKDQDVFQKYFGGK